MASLPLSLENTVIIVVVDRFSKAAYFGMLSTHFTACKVAKLFSTMIRKIHGYPKRT